jgi:hypothetical protein
MAPGVGGSSRREVAEADARGRLPVVATSRVGAREQGHIGRPGQCGVAYPQVRRRARMTRRGARPFASCGAGSASTKMWSSGPKAGWHPSVVGDVRGRVASAFVQRRRAFEVRDRGGGWRWVARGPVRWRRHAWRSDEVRHAGSSNRDKKLWGVPSAGRARAVEIRSPWAHGDSRARTHRAPPRDSTNRHGLSRFSLAPIAFGCRWWEREHQRQCFHAGGRLRRARRGAPAAVGGLLIETAPQGRLERNSAVPRRGRAVTLWRGMAQVAREDVDGL